MHSKCSKILLCAFTCSRFLINTETTAQMNDSQLHVIHLLHFIFGFLFTFPHLLVLLLTSVRPLHLSFWNYRMSPALYKRLEPTVQSTMFNSFWILFDSIWRRYRLESYSKDGDIISYKCWLSDQCMNLKKQNDSVSCLRWLAEFADVRGLLPLEEHYFTSNSMYNLNEGFKLCIELRQIIQIAAKELLQRWLSVSEPLHLHNDNIYTLLCCIKILFRIVFQVCQTESGMISTVDDVSLLYNSLT